MLPWRKLEKWKKAYCSHIIFLGVIFSLSKLDFYHCCLSMFLESSVFLCRYPLFFLLAESSYFSRFSPQYLLLFFFYLTLPLFLPSCDSYQSPSSFDCLFHLVGFCIPSVHQISQLTLSSSLFFQLCCSLSCSVTLVFVQCI